MRTYKCMRGYYFKYVIDVECVVAYTLEVVKQYVFGNCGGTFDMVSSLRRRACRNISKPGEMHSGMSSSFSCSEFKFRQCRIYLKVANWQNR